MTEQVSLDEFNKLNDLVISMRDDLEKIKSQSIGKSSSSSREDVNKLDESIAILRNDVEKIKQQVVDKVPKGVLAELEGNLNNHSKLIESFSNKLYELQNNLNTFTQKPVTQIMMETMRSHLTEEIMANVTAMFDDYVEKNNQDIEDKHKELKQIIQNTKRFAFIK